MKENKVNYKDDILGIKDIIYKLKLSLNKKDAITQLYNREYFIHYLEKKKNGTIIKIKFIGLDFINLSCGPETSKLLIKFISKKLKYITDNYIVSRLSRTKFGIYTEETDINKIKKLIDDITLIISNINQETKGIKISVNIAVVIYNENDFDINDALGKLELSISNSIRKGYNKYEIYNEKYEPYINVESIENAIKNEEILLYYQPKVDSENGKIKGVEALIRWFNKEYGYVNAEKLIGFAEDSGYINKLGKWIIKRACKEIKEINETLEEKIDLSVNISPLQLEDKDFLKEVNDIINEVGFEHELLKFEITENQDIGSIETIVKIFEEIKRTGIKISIDDFGKGYNSIDFIKNYDIDEIKIDKSIVKYLSSNPLFIKNLIDMIHTTNTVVVAEGVEKDFEYELLKKMGCDLIQGYYCYKPVELKSLVEIIMKDVI